MIARRIRGKRGGLVICPAFTRPSRLSGEVDMVVVTVKIERGGKRCCLRGEENKDGCWLLFVVKPSYAFCRYNNTYLSSLKPSDPFQFPLIFWKMGGYFYIETAKKVHIGSASLCVISKVVYWVNI